MQAGVLTIVVALPHRCNLPPLPDFHISAHATVSNLTVLTRDSTRYRTYFPRLDSGLAVTLGVKREAVEITTRC